MTQELPDEIFSAKYYTIRYNRRIKTKWGSRVHKRQWVIGFTAVHKDRCVFRFVSEMFSEYLKTHNRFPDYFFMDIILTIALRYIPEFRNDWRKVPDNNMGWFELLYMFEDGQEWDQEKYSDLAGTNTVLRLTYKEEYATRTASGKETFYGHLLSEYGITG